MKLKYTITALFTAGLLGTTSCVNDLDVFPLDPNVNSSNVAYDSAESYMQALAKIYSVWAFSGQNGAGDSDISGLDAGNTVLLRCWFTLQENTTDEAKCAWNDAWVSSINQITWTTAQVESIEGAYQRAMFVVSLVNDYMKYVGDAPENSELYAAEARFCRALAYYTLMDLFARPPFITEDNYSLMPSQLTRAELFNWIESELLDIYDALPTNPEYGRAGRYAVDALLSRMYLNASVYTGSLTNSDGENYYTMCITRCNNIINGGVYSLADNYAELFMADNGENANAKKEIIFPICADGETGQSYGIGAIICGSRSTNEADPLTDGCVGWDGFRSTGNLVRMFEFESSNEDDWTADNILDKRGIFYSNNRSIDIVTSPQQTFTSEGWAVYKYSNVGSDGTPGSNTTFPDTDFPLFRLGEIYLNYAEAVARGGQGGSASTAVGYINALRQRGYGDDNHSISEDWLTASVAIGGKTGSIQYGNLLAERSRELYWEATRRTDLVRFGVFTSGTYVWAAKGGVITGVGVDDHYNVFPIPTTDMSVNSSLTQNDGY